MSQFNSPKLPLPASDAHTGQVTSIPSAQPAVASQQLLEGASLRAERTTPSPDQPHLAQHQQLQNAPREEVVASHAAPQVSRPSLLNVASQWGGTWAVAGYVSLSLVWLFEPTTTPFAATMAALATVSYLAIGSWGLSNKFREEIREAKGSAQEKEHFEFKPGVLGYLQAELLSPGAWWKALCLISITNSLVATCTGSPVDGVMFSLFALGHTGASRDDDKQVKYWERFAAFKSGKPLEEVSVRSPLDPIISHPGIPWCIGDVLAGVRSLDFQSLQASWLVGGATTVGIFLGVYGALSSIIPKGSRESSTAQDSATEVQMNALQQAAFVVANIAMGNVMAIPLVFWGISAYFIAKGMLKERSAKGVQDLGKGESLLQPPSSSGS